MKFELIQVKKLKLNTLAPVINLRTALMAITIAPISYLLYLVTYLNPTTRVKRIMMVIIKLNKGREYIQMNEVSTVIT